jgi:nitrite reductase/ring-hydroxylating ferredoxin subunit
MAIKSYPNKAAYDAAVKPTIESQVSMIETTREILVDGVNVITTSPVVGDVVFLNESNEITYVKGGSWIQKAIIPSAWVHVGYVYLRKGRQVGVIDKNAADQKWLDVCQYAITAISGTSLTINLSMAPSYAQVATTVELASTDIDATNAAAISAAVAAKATEVGDTRAWWAYLADADGNKVDENGTQIIIQCDTCTDSRFYNVSATGCTIAHITWGDMPENSNYWRGERGYYTNYWGVMNIAKTKAWATGSGRVPTQNEPVGPRAGNDAPVKPSEFASSQYCADLRAAYSSYEEYLEKCYAVVCPQKYGCFALPDGAAMAERYARKTAPTKDGGNKYKYPALYYGYNRTYGVDGLDFGDWHLPGVLEGTELMKDACLAALAPSVTKMGTTAINNGTDRWFAERCNVNNAWFFVGSGGFLYDYIVFNRLRCQAVALLEID